MLRSLLAPINALLDGLRHRVVYLLEYDHPQLIELLMMSLSLVFTVVAGFSPLWDWPYWTMAIAFGIGGALCSLVRETLVPSPKTMLVRSGAVMVIVLSGLILGLLLGYWQSVGYW